MPPYLPSRAGDSVAGLLRAESLGPDITHFLRARQFEFIL